MIPLTKPSFDENDVNLIRKVLDSGWVAGQGPMNQQLAIEFAKYLNVKGAVPVNNCTAALHLSLLSIGVSTGDEALVSDFTFPATGHAVLYTGAKPIFVDSDLGTYNIDLDDLVNKIGPKTKAIIPVHSFGNPVKITELIKIAKENNLKVIEDAACAIGAKYRNQYVGSFGDINCFSFHARKVLAAGEGGIITSNDQELINKASSLSNYGMASAKVREKSDEIVIPVFTDLGYNYKLSD
ncbi:MAG: DegT/DnrJ/EryC1/StrS family aminotransferase, partial [Candidatus Hodarchaeales archaeon]